MVLTDPESPRCSVAAGDYEIDALFLLELRQFVFDTEYSRGSDNFTDVEYSQTNEPLSGDRGGLVRSIASFRSRG